MRIGFLSKRRYMGKDVIDDRYARLYEIPYQLARLGHSVTALCLGYQNQREGRWSHDAPPGELTWAAFSFGKTSAHRLLRYPHRALSLLSEFSPDLLIGASDIPQVVLVAWLAKQLHVPYAVDLYDNFEGFGQAYIPGAVSALRKAVRNAALVTATSEPLAEFVRDTYCASGEVISVPSTVDKRVFRPLDQLDCRKRLGLPLHAKLIGTAGGLHKAKGVGTVYAAWSKIAAAHADVHLVLAGPLDGKLDPPQHERVHYLGELPHTETAILFNALDVGVIYIRDTKFGRFCFPQKAYEMIGCRLPLVAADIGAMHSLLSGYPECLYRPDDADDLAYKLVAQLRTPTVPDIEINGWQQLVRVLEPQLSIAAGCSTDAPV